MKNISSFKHSDITNAAFTICVYILRDINRFAEFGVHADIVEDFLVKVNDFINFPQDVGIYQEKSLITEQKKIRRNELLLQIKKIRNRIRGYYGLTSALFLQLGTKNISNVPTQELLAVCQRIGQLYDENTPAFAAASVSPAMMSVFAAALAAYSGALNEQTAAANKRAISAISRNQQAVEIYETLAKWCLFGQTIWKEESKAYYKNYLLIRTIRGSKKAKKKGDKKQQEDDV